MSNDPNKKLTGTDVERFLDNDMTVRERQVFEEWMWRDEWVEREMELARSILAGLHSMETPDLPEYVTRGVRRTIRHDLTGDVTAWLRIVYQERIRPRFKPVFAMASLLTLVVSAAFLGRSTPIHVVSGVESARQDVEWTLAYLSRVSRRTGSVVRRSAIQPLVVGPVSDAVRLLSANGEDE